MEDLLKEAQSEVIALRNRLNEFHDAIASNDQILPQVIDVTFDSVYKASSARESFGGDWFKVQPIARLSKDGLRKSDVLAISLGDVAGHGTEAAIVMMNVVQTIQMALVAEHEPPSAILSKANQMLNSKDSPLVTAIFGFLNVVEQTFEYASAGQMPPLWVSREGHAEYLPTSGIPLCCESQLITSDQYTKMPSGSSIVLFSDGLVEQEHHQLDRSLENLRSICADEMPRFNPHPAKAIYDRMWGKVARLDDVSILTFTMKNKQDVTPASWR